MHHYFLTLINGKAPLCTIQCLKSICKNLLSSRFQFKIGVLHLGDAPFDIIIDDGSHVPWHQIFTLESIFHTWLKPGGLYIIEDLETSYWDAPRARIYGYDILDAGIGKRGSAVEKLKWMVDVLSRKVRRCRLDPYRHRM